MTAEQACAEYERWAAEVARLTQAIAETRCPREPTLDALTGLQNDDGSDSCFSKAKIETTDADNWIPGHANRPLNLDEIEEEVEDCESCTRLVGFIRERKHARQRFGVAKRQVRVVGKRMFATEGG